MVGGKVIFGYGSEHFQFATNGKMQPDALRYRYALCRHTSETLPVEISLQGFSAATIIDHQVMTHASLEATNTLTSQSNVVPAQGKGANVSDGLVHSTMPPHSHQMLRLKLAKL